MASKSPSERRSNLATFKKAVRSRSTTNKDPLYRKAGEMYAKGGKVSPSVAKKMWRQYGIKLPVKKGGRRRPGPHDIGATPGRYGPK